MGLTKIDDQEHTHPQPIRFQTTPEEINWVQKSTRAARGGAQEPLHFNTLKQT